MNRNVSRRHVAILAAPFLLPAMTSDAFGAVPWNELSADDGRSIGRGATVVVEMMDYNCSFCRLAHAAMGGTLASRPDIKVVRRDLPVLGASSLTAAAAVQAADLQGRIAAMHDVLMRVRAPLDVPLIVRAATEAGVNPERLGADVDGIVVKERMARILDVARRSGATGTPTYFLRSGAFMPGFGSPERFLAFVDGGLSR